jgi:hypothetical protein
MRRTIVSKLAFIFLLTTHVAVGQDQSRQLPDAPSAHRFFDKQNVASLTVLAGLATVDSISTQHILDVHHGRELNPLARALVTRGWQGQMAMSVVGYGAALTTAYAFHKTGHHRWERWSTRLAILGEAISVTNNLALNAHESERSVATVAWRR